ncbi:MAG: class I SAM-dependent methyltransferase [Jaaginema sp. PMC 1080.18]|nr:class I SAM-dependent methyltransferase [Jaaginema sp. PMC 1080.18]
MKEPILEPLLRKLRLYKVLKQIPNQCVILDIGCGNTASFLRAVSPKIRQGFGIDFKVSDFETNNIQIKQHKFQDNLPFQDGYFDVVTMLAVLEHIEKEKEILEEVHRVLVPGGKLILTVPSVWSQPVLEFLSYRLKIISEVEIRDHKRYYNRMKLRNSLIEKAKFSDFYHQYFQFWMNNFCIVVKK